MKVHHLLFVIVLIVMSACNRNDNVTRETICGLVGKEMPLPGVNLQCVSYGGDCDPDLLHSDFTILNFIDSGGCTVCYMDLKKWESVLELLHSATDADISFAMVVLHKQRSDIIEILGQEGFRYPVFLDSDGRYTLGTGASTIKTLNTVLLDAENKVLAVGNPVLNPQVYDLFVELMAGDSIDNVPHKGGLIAAPVEVNLSYLMAGAVKLGESVQLEIPLTNMSDSVLHIVDVVTSCECIEVVVPCDSIKPGVSLCSTITVTNDTRAPLESRFHRVVDFNIAGFDMPVSVIISGYGVN